MRVWVCVLAVLILTLSGLISASAPSSAMPSTLNRTVNSFEGATVDDVTAWGSWSHASATSGGGTSASVTTTGAEFLHLVQSAQLYADAPAIATRYGDAQLMFTSDLTWGSFPWDVVQIRYKASVGGAGATAGYYFRQLDGGLIVMASSGVIITGGWKVLTFSGPWDPLTDQLFIEFWTASVGDDGGGTAEIWVDYLTMDSGIVNVRLSYWNLYTGFGYYPEKLFAEYRLGSTWVTIWQNEFQSYKGEDVLIHVTDGFGRAVYTNIVTISTDPFYVNIYVPIITVIIPAPSGYDESVPWEWSITCLPWGPDGPAGMSLTGVGMEFEVLAGWYTISWLENEIAESGNATVYIDGNATARRSFMLTNVTIPMKSDYTRTIESGGGVFDFSNGSSIVKLFARLYELDITKAILLLSGVGGFVLVARAYYSSQRKKAEKRKQLEGQR